MRKILCTLLRILGRGIFVFLFFFFVLVAFQYLLILLGVNVGDLYVFIILSAIVSISSLVLNSKKKLLSFLKFFIDTRQLFYLVIFLFLVYLFWSKLIAPIQPIQISTNNVAEIEALKYELFRDLLMAFLAFIAVGAALIYVFIRRGIQESLNKEIERLETLLHCKIDIIRCLRVENENGKNIEDILTGKTIITELPVWLKSNIDLSKKILSKSERLDKIKDESTILYAKNNLAYYLSVGKIEERKAKELAEEVYKKTEHPGRYHSIDTYIWVILRFATTTDEIKKARHIFFSELYDQREFLPDPLFKQKLERYKTFFEKI